MLHNSHYMKKIQLPLRKAFHKLIGHYTINVGCGSAQNFFNLSFLSRHSSTVYTLCRASDWLLAGASATWATTQSC